MKKIVLFEGDIETQGYFSGQMAKAFEQMGHEVLLYHLEKSWEYSGKLLRFVERGNTVMISFNFHGMAGEPEFIDEEGNWFWDCFDIPCLNILVDHPLYYYELLGMRPKNYIQISIDHEHEEFMKLFFPQVKLGGFLPLAGTSLFPTGNFKKMCERDIDVVITGNYASPDTFKKYITRIDDEYTAFYMGMVEDLMSHPQKTVTEVCVNHIKDEIAGVTGEEIKITMPNLNIIDLYVRHVLRSDVVRTLVDSGIKVHTVGGKWNELKCKHPENLINEGQGDSLKCLQMIANSKISLNVLPWFKHGAHDRVFNSMLNGAVCLTDSNAFMNQFLVHKHNCMIYEATNLEKLPDMAREILKKDELADQIAMNGFKLASRDHTWKKRCEILSEYIEKL